MVDEKKRNIDDEVEENSSDSDVLYQKTIAKMNKAGNRQVGSFKVEVKKYEGVKFVMLTQDKFAFGDKPQKRTWVTFDPTNEEIKKALKEAINS